MAEIGVIVTGVTEADAASLLKDRPVAPTPAYALFYPLYAFQFHIALKRLFFGPREVELFVMVDAGRGTASLADTFPDLEQTVCDPASLLVGTVSREAAFERALEKAKRRIYYRYPTWWPPKIDVAKEALVYKRYWVFREAVGDGASLWIIDSFDGRIRRLPLPPSGSAEKGSGAGVSGQAF